MPDLTPELLLAALVVTSLACGGLLGLWAATSRRHWFVRTMVVSAALAPLLWRPIYEPFVTLLVEVATVVLGVMIYQRKWPQWRFSVGSLLLLTVPVAFLTTAAMRAPELDWVYWVYSAQTAGFGLLGGTIALLAAWLCRSKWRWWKRAVVFVVALPLLAVAWYWTNYVDDDISWFDLFGNASNFVLDFETYKGSLWAALSVAGFVFAVVMALPIVLHAADGTKSPRWRRGLAAIAAAALLPIPIYFAWVLSNPLPIPKTLPTASPAYTELIALPKSPAFVSIETVGAGNTINWQAMEKAVLAADAEYDRALALVDEPLTVPVSLEDWALSLPDIQAHRAIARAWHYKAKVAREAGDLATATQACEWLLHFTQRLEGQGLLVNALINSAIDGLALDEVYRAAPLLNATQARRLARFLALRNRNRPSLEPMWIRNRISNENADGWQGHLGFLLEDWPDDPIDVMRNGMTWGAQKRVATVGSLLSADLALRAQQLESGEYPATLDDLVPEYLPHVPTDPCSDTDQPLLYRRTDESYLLYSRGCDGDDDGGQPCVKNDERYGFGWTDWRGDGDLSLDAYYADENE